MLHLAYYKMLEKLPKAALPDTPPRGEHQYKLWLSTWVNVTMRFSPKKMVLNHMWNKRSKTWHFHDEFDIERVWDKMRGEACSWIHDPDVACPRLVPLDSPFRSEPEEDNDGGAAAAHAARDNPAGEGGCAAAAAPADVAMEGGEGGNDSDLESVDELPAADVCAADAAWAWRDRGDVSARPPLHRARPLDLDSDSDASSSDSLNALNLSSMSSSSD